MLISEKELRELHGQKKLKLSSYYKFSFSFKNAGGDLLVCVGGNHDDIYRLEVDAEREYTLNELFDLMPISMVRQGQEWVYDTY